MNFTILIPTYNNLKYLRLFCESIKINSNFDHQLIFHINDGSDGSYDYINNLLILKRILDYALQ